MKINRKLLAGLTAAGMLVGMAGIASADNVQNDVVPGLDGNVVTVEAGDAGATVNFRVHATGGDTGDTNGRDGESCNPVHSGAVTVTFSSSPAGASITGGTPGANQLTFSDCDTGKPLTFKSATSGTYTISASASGTAGQYNVSPATFTLQVDEAPADEDTTAPVNSISGFEDEELFLVGVDTLPTPACVTIDEVGGSGVNPEDPAVLSSEGGPLGKIKITCTGGKDLAGNTAENVSADYYVQYGRDGGIGQPINPDGTSQFSQKRAVPVKFKLQGDELGGHSVSTFTLKRTAVPCTQGASFTAEDATVLPISGSTTWRYDGTDDHYIYNATLNGTTAGACYQYQVDLGDGGTRVISPTFKVTK